MNVELDRFRYRVHRSWGPGDPLTFILRHPGNTDRDIAICSDLARREGYDAVELGFLHPLIEPDGYTRSTASWTIPDWAEMSNEINLVSVLNRGSKIVAAWGNPKPLFSLADWFVARARRFDVELWCYSRTRSGGWPVAPPHIWRDASPSRFV